MLWLVEDNWVVCGPLTAHEDRGRRALVVLRGESSRTEHYYSTMRIRVLYESTTMVVNAVDTGTVRPIALDGFLEERAGVATKVDMRRSRCGSRGWGWSRCSSR